MLFSLLLRQEEAGGVIEVSTLFSPGSSVHRYTAAKIASLPYTLSRGMDGRHPHGPSGQHGLKDTNMVSA